MSAANNGARPSDQALVASDGAASVSTLSGFDHGESESEFSAASMSREAGAMWLRLARSTKAIVEGSEDWAGEEPSQTARIIQWAEHAEFCFMRAAQVGRNAKRQDPEEGLGPKDEHAVGEADAPNLGSEIHDQ